MPGSCTAWTGEWDHSSQPIPATSTPTGQAGGIRRGKGKGSPPAAPGRVEGPEGWGAASAPAGPAQGGRSPTLKGQVGNPDLTRTLLLLKAGDSCELRPAWAKPGRRPGPAPRRLPPRPHCACAGHAGRSGAGGAGGAAHAPGCGRPLPWSRPLPSGRCASRAAAAEPQCASRRGGSAPLTGGSARPQPRRARGCDRRRQSRPSGPLGRAAMPRRRPCCGPRRRPGLLPARRAPWRRHIAGHSGQRGASPAGRPANRAFTWMTCV